MGRPFCTTDSPDCQMPQRHHHLGTLFIPLKQFPASRRPICSNTIARNHEVLAPLR